jgi:hypothetical protein
MEVLAVTKLIKFVSGYEFAQICNRSIELTFAFVLGSSGVAIVAGIIKYL